MYSAERNSFRGYPLPALCVRRRDSAAPMYAQLPQIQVTQEMQHLKEQVGQIDQVLRSHLRRVQRGGVPADYFECGGDAGYRRSSSLRGSGGGGSSRTRGHV